MANKPLLYRVELPDVEVEVLDTGFVIIPASRFRSPWEQHSVYTEIARELAYFHAEEGPYTINIGLMECQVTVLNYLDQEGHGIVVWEYYIPQNDTAPEPQYTLIDQEGRQPAAVNYDPICIAPPNSTVSFRRASEDPRDTCPVEHIMVLGIVLMRPGEEA